MPAFNFQRFSFSAFQHFLLIAFAMYAFFFSFLTLRPLARYADAPAQRKVEVEFVEPPAGARTFLVQEVQSAYYHPELYHLSTEGLITPEAYEAWKAGKTLREFILEQKPDLIGFGRYYLKDPEGFQEKINTAAVEGRDLDLGDIRLKHAGQMKGAGPFFVAEYGMSTER